MNVKLEPRRGVDWVVEASAGFDPIGAVGNWRNVAIAVAGLLLIILTLYGLMKARNGDLKKTAQISAGAVIALLPIALAGGILAIAAAMGDWFGFGGST